MGLYVRVEPYDRRIHFICDDCAIDRIELTYSEALREAKAHKALHNEGRAA